MMPSAIKSAKRSALSELIKSMAKRRFKDEAAGSEHSRPVEKDLGFGNDEETPEEESMETPDYEAKEEASLHDANSQPGDREPSLKDDSEIEEDPLHAAVKQYMKKGREGAMRPRGGASLTVIMAAGKKKGKK